MVGSRKGRAVGKIPLPPRVYGEAMAAVGEVRNPIQRWWYRRRVGGWRKFPLVEGESCYYWERREKRVRQWRTFRGFTAGEVGEIEGWVEGQGEIGVDAEDGGARVARDETARGRGRGQKWKRSWNRRTPVSRTYPNGQWRGAVDRESVEKYRKERAAHWARKVRIWVYRRCSIQVRNLGT